MRIRLLNENRARDCQEIEALRRTCCEEIGRAREVRIRDSGLPRHTRNTMGTSGNVFESLLARESPPSSIY